MFLKWAREQNKLDSGYLKRFEKHSPFYNEIWASAKRLIYSKYLFSLRERAELELASEVFPKVTFGLDDLPPDFDYLGFYKFSLFVKYEVAFLLDNKSLVTSFPTLAKDFEDIKQAIEGGNELKLIKLKSTFIKQRHFSDFLKNLLPREDELVLFFDLVPLLFETITQDFYKRDYTEKRFKTSSQRLFLSSFKKQFPKLWAMQKESKDNNALAACFMIFTKIPINEIEWKDRFDNEKIRDEAKNALDRIR